VPAERVLTVAVERHVFETGRPFDAVLSGIYAGISQPDISALFTALAAAPSYQEFSALVSQAQGGAGLMRFLQLDLDAALTSHAGTSSPRLVRIIAGNPVTMEQMTRHVPDAGSYAPVTILVQETPSGTRVAYDTVTSELAPYQDDSARAVAEQLDQEVLTLLRQAAAPLASLSSPVRRSALSARGSPHGRTAAPRRGRRSRRAAAARRSRR
jgi:uncharacterized protein (DUF302 family)